MHYFMRRKNTHMWDTHLSYVWKWIILTYVRKWSVIHLSPLKIDSLRLEIVPLLFDARIFFLEREKPWHPPRVVPHI
jgi:hypothetical protein